MLLDLHGSSALPGGNALSRFWRDVDMGSRHSAVNPYVVADQLDNTLAPEKLAAEDSHIFRDAGTQLAASLTR
ncbi:hypothetical protein [Streptomyces chartreusis]